MSSIDRRQWLGGVGALAATAGAANAAGEARMYDYLFLDLQPGAEGTPARLSDHVNSHASDISAAGGQALGLFTPQLGWHARQAALLLGWPAEANRRDAIVKTLQSAPGVAAARRERLNATARPAAGDRPPPGGIYVHRWFVVESPATAEFINLSTEGWRDFEARFETHIFGLFTAQATAEDTRAGVTRFLLITQYKDHGVWEASRNPTTAAMAAFMRRQKLTRDTWAASTLLFPLQGA